MFASREGRPIQEKSRPERAAFFIWWRSADPGAAIRQRRGRAAGAARQLRLIGAAAMFDAIGEAGVHLLATEMEVGLAGVTDRPLADLLVEIEQAGLAGDLGVGLAGTSRRGGAGGIGCCISPGP